MPWYTNGIERTHLGEIPNLEQRPALAEGEDGFILRYEDKSYGVRVWVHPETKAQRVQFEMIDDQGLYWDEFTKEE